MEPQSQVTLAPAVVDRRHDWKDDPEARRSYEEELLIGEVYSTVHRLLASSQVRPDELARRLAWPEARVHRMLADGNIPLRDLAAVAWALGIRFELHAAQIEDRVGMPAENDPPAPEWLAGDMSVESG